MIAFGDNFSKESGEFVIFDMPTELKSQLSNEGELSIQEYKNDSYIIGKDKLYQVVKYQVSNLMLICDQKLEPVSNKEKLIVRSFQQSHLIPTPVKPFSRDLLMYLRTMTIGELDSNKKEGLSTEELKRRFVTNDHFLRKVTY